MSKQKKVTTIKSLEEANQRLAELKIAEAQLKILTSELNIKHTKLENEYSMRIAELKEKRLLCQTDIELFAETHKGELNNKRSWSLLHGDFGFRQSQKLTTLPKFNWSKVLDAIEKAGGRFKTYIRTKTEIAKDELKSDLQAGVITAQEANEIGVKIDVVDNFFIEPNTIEVDKAA
mgnify:CR=1 FL=1